MCHSIIYGDVSILINVLHIRGTESQTAASGNPTSFVPFSTLSSASLAGQPFSPTSVLQSTSSVIINSGLSQVIDSHITLVIEYISSRMVIIKVNYFRLLPSSVRASESTSTMSEITSSLFSLIFL